MGKIKTLEELGYIKDYEYEKKFKTYGFHCELIAYKRNNVEVIRIFPEDKDFYKSEEGYVAMIDFEEFLAINLKYKELGFLSDVKQLREKRGKK